MQGRNVKYRSLFRFSTCLFFLFAFGLFLCRAASAGSSGEPFRVGFSADLFTDVNENDAKAAVKVWGELIAKEQGIPTEPAPLVFKDREKLLDSLRGKLVDAVGIAIDEYQKLCREIRFGPIFLSSMSGRYTERYVLLVNSGGFVKSIGDLEGRIICFHKNSRNCLAPQWLDTLLVSQGYPTATRLAGRILKDTSLSQVVLPVFFRKADACVVTRRGFDTMCELNPQLAERLSVLAESREIVPTVLAMRADYTPSYKEKLVSSLNELHNSPAGRQVLLIFQSDAMEEQPPAVLDATLELIATHERLVKGIRP